jgi:prephenate dehydrogenase
VPLARAPRCRVTADLHIVGTGLIGTSVGLAVRGTRDVVLSDASAAARDLAVERGAGRPWDGVEDARLVLVAVPPSMTPGVTRSLQGLNLGLTWSHVASVQAPVQREIQRLGCDLTATCGGHPLAGRELSGPEAALQELFEGRPWVLCPSAATSPSALAAVRELAEACGAEPVEMDPVRHDRSVALVSHLPQVAASAVAAQLFRGTASGAVALAGPGLRDTTRVAASDPALWVQVLRANAEHVAPLVRALADDLAALAEALDAVAAVPGADEDARAVAAVERLLRRGVEGRRLVPVKGAAHDEDFVTVHVSVPDRPGQLAGILATAAEARVNVEDVHVEHLRGRPRGVVQLLVHASSVTEARRALTAGGWDVVTAG